MSATDLLHNISKEILNPLILFLFAVAFLVFVWGIFRFIYNSGDDTEQEEGKKAMMWGIIGMFVMVSVGGIIRLVLDTFNISPPAGLP